MEGLLRNGTVESSTPEVIEKLKALDHTVSELNQRLNQLVTRRRAGEIDKSQPRGNDTDG